MSRLILSSLKVIAPLAASATPTHIVQNQSDPTNSIPAATGISILPYTPKTDIQFSNYQNIISVRMNLPSTSQIVKFIYRDNVQKLAEDSGAPDISGLIGNVPFTSISTIYTSVVDAAIVKLQDDLANYGSDIPSADDQRKLAEDFYKKVNDDFANYVTTDDSYKLAGNATDLDAFLDDLIAANIPLGIVDKSKLVSTVASQLLDEVNDSTTQHTNDEFYDALVAKYPDTDSFKGVIVNKIIDEYIDKDQIHDVIEEDINGIYVKYDDNIKKFGLATMQTNFEGVKALVDKNNGDPVTGIGSIVNKFLSDLKDMSSLSDSTTVIGRFNTAKTNFEKSQDTLIKNKSDEMITKVQND